MRDVQTVFCLIMFSVLFTILYSNIKYKEGFADGYQNRINYEKGQ